jgi:hypothetical protein
MRSSKTFRTLAAVVIAVVVIAVAATQATERQKANRGVTNIVLVHGAWADGSSWSRVTPLLASKDLHVDAVQLPLTSQADDVGAVNATSITLQSSHVAMLSQPYVVASFIRKAAREVE